MGRNRIYTAIILAFVWVALREEFTLLTLAVGAVLGSACVYFYQKYLPLSSTGLGMKFSRLAFYFFYLIGQIYLSGFDVIKLFFTGARLSVVNFGTGLAGNELKIILADSITLTPGTITIDLYEDRLNVLWLRRSNDFRDSPEHDVGDIVKGDLERQLIKVQR